MCVYGRGHFDSEKSKAELQVLGSGRSKPPTGQKGMPYEHLSGKRYG
jgi:hypothetical protein